ncbi:MAG: peptide deformylase [Candidatus Peribacteria bacterium]|jgi:peptide deformylase|nr:peptide deformylase [Candidatus Peribacteria bacterium]
MSTHSIFYPIITGENNPILRKKSAPIQEFTPEIEEFAEILLELMYEYDGIGLSAPQLGQNIRMIAVTDWRETKGKKDRKGNPKRTLIGEQVLVNPEILEFSKTTQVNEEGCLSVPNAFGNVRRSTGVKVKYSTPQGKSITKKFSGRNAIVIQHEIDHLDGILFIDKLV